MTSFIELPRLTFHGQPRGSAYVNTADIVYMESGHDGQTAVGVRELGSQGLGVVQTYVPLESLLDVLAMLAERPGTRSWSEDSKVGWAAPISHELRAAFERERAKTERFT